MRPSLKLSAAISIFTAVFAISGRCLAREPVESPDNAVGKALGNYALIDQDGRLFNLKELFGKPLVISYAYTSCTHTCTPTLAKLKRAFGSDAGGLGVSFSALTIGFDTENDTPEKLRDYGKNFTGDFSAWRFATSTRKTMDSLTKELGFYHEKDGSGGFEHINLVTIAGKDGKVVKQLYGAALDPGDVVKAIRLALSAPPPTPPLPADAAVKTLSIIDRLRLFCYTYDESTGRYRLNYGAVATLTIGTLLQGITIGWIIYLIVRKKEA